MDEAREATSDHYQACHGNKDNENRSDHVSLHWTVSNSGWLGANCLGALCLFVRLLVYLFGPREFSQKSAGFQKAVDKSGWGTKILDKKF
jgi:hypothetical protein